MMTKTGIWKLAIIFFIFFIVLFLKYTYDSNKFTTRIRKLELREIQLRIAYEEVQWQAFLDFSARGEAENELHDYQMRIDSLMKILERDYPYVIAEIIMRLEVREPGPLSPDIIFPPPEPPVPTPDQCINPKDKTA